MAWYDDHWRDGYDAWKLASPDDDQDECFHEEYEADINGRATCNYCGDMWQLTEEEINIERELHVAFDKMMRREERRKRIEGWMRKLAFWRRWRKPEVVNDLPF